MDVRVVRNRSNRSRDLGVYASISQRSVPTPCAYADIQHAISGGRSIVESARMQFSMDHMLCRPGLFSSQQLVFVTMQQPVCLLRVRVKNCQGGTSSSSMIAQIVVGFWLK